MVGNRLASIRDAADLSLREFAGRVEEAGYSVSHAAVRQYERRESVPSAYLLAVAEVFDVDPAWLFTGDDSYASDVRETLREFPPDTAAIRRAWKDFAAGLQPDHLLRSTILASWRRCERAGVEPDRDDPDVRKVSDDELANRRQSESRLVSASAPHLSWLSDSVDPVPHVAYLTDSEGVVLDALGAEEETLEELGLAPGYVWSEEEVGTNGAGTALATGRPTVVFGPEHFVGAFHGFVCTGCPVREEGGEIVGAVDLTTPLHQGRPQRLALATYAALAIEREFFHAGASEGRQ